MTTRVAVVVLMMACVSGLAACQSRTTTHKDMFYLKDHFIDARELFDDKLAPRPGYGDDVYKLFDFEKSDRISVIFDKAQFVPDETGIAPDGQGLYYPANADANKVTVRFDLENVEVVEFLDLQAYSGCLDHNKHPVNLAVSRFDPDANVKSAAYTIKMPCRRYYSVPSHPYESVLMVKVKTRKGYYYNIHKLYSAARNECLLLHCRQSRH